MTEQTEVSECDQAVDDVLRQMSFSKSPAEMQRQLEQMTFFIKALVFRIGGAQGNRIHIRNSDLRKSATCILDVIEDQDSGGLNLVLTEPGE